MKTPLIVHVHVPKTAGCSFRTLLQKRFGQNHANLYWDNKPFEYTESYLDEFVSSRPSLRSLSSHFVQTFPPRIAGREALYITFLRKPVEQFISYLTYTRKHFDKIPDKELLESVPPDVPDLSLRDFASWILSHRRIPFRQNNQVNFFAQTTFRRTWCECEDDYALYCGSRLLLAKVLLDRFFFVGIAERMDESIERLEWLGDQFDIDVPEGPIGVENVSNEYRDDLAWINTSDDVGARLLASVAEDQDLYDWNLARFEQTRTEKVGAADYLSGIRRATEPPVLTQLFWSLAGEDFSESQSVGQRWVIGSGDSLYRLEMPRFERPPTQFRLDLADRPINLRVSRISLLDTSGTEIWRMRLDAAAERLVMAGMKCLVDEATGGIRVEIEDWDPAILLPVDADALARLDTPRAVEIVMSAL